jgi:toxin ParE1/3/4
LVDHFRLNIVLSDAAKRDLADILERSFWQFGEAAALRYNNLIRQALRDIEADRERIGSASRSDVVQGGRTYHLQLSRQRIASGRVKSPRHLLLYRRRENEIQVIRILHDGQDPKRNLPEPYRSN